MLDGIFAPGSPADSVANFPLSFPPDGTINLSTTPPTPRTYRKIGTAQQGGYSFTASANRGPRARDTASTRSVISRMPSYTKPATDYSGQITILASRGLVIADPVFAGHCLAHHNYYRLSAYRFPFTAPGNPDLFLPGTTFEQLWALYDFDRQLRRLHHREKVGALAHRSILGEVASGLAHHPDRWPLHRLSPARAEEEVVHGL